MQIYYFQMQVEFLNLQQLQQHYQVSMYYKLHHQEVFVPDVTELPTPTQAKKFGLGIGIVSLGVT